MRLLWTGTVLVAVTVVTIAARSALASREDARLALSQLVAVTEQAKDVVRQRELTFKFPVQPAGGLAGRVSGALSRCGLMAAVLQGLSPEAETLIGDGPRRAVRQRATLTLSGLSLPQVGTFLDAWRSAEPDWTVTSIELSPLDRGGTLGSDLPLRAVLMLEGLFREAPPPTPPLRGINP
jgi:hypothetical protein